MQQIIQFLVATLAPVKIYKIQAPGAAGCRYDNQVELAIVVANSFNTRFPALEPILQLATLQHTTVHCSVHQEAHVLTGLRSGHIFYSLCCIPGNLVYDNGQEDYPVTETADLNRIKATQQKVFAAIFQRAASFLDCSRALLQRPTDHLIAFMLHQAIELTYRAVLLSLNGLEKKTHEIRVLMKLAQRSALPLNMVWVTSQCDLTQLILFLDAAYIKARYQVEYCSAGVDFRLIYNKVRELQEFAVVLVGERLCL